MNSVTLTQNQFDWLVSLAFAGVVMFAGELGLLLGQVAWDIRSRFRRNEVAR